MWNLTVLTAYSADETNYLTFWFSFLIYKMTISMHLIIQGDATRLSDNTYKVCDTVLGGYKVHSSVGCYRIFSNILYLYVFSIYILLVKIQGLTSFFNRNLSSITEHI